MVTALVAALMAVLGFGGLMALRYARTRTRFALTVGAVIGAETLALAILFIAVATGKWTDTPWLNYPVSPLAKQLFGVLLAAAVLGSCFFLIKRFLGVGHQTREAVLFTILVPFLVITVLISARAVQVGGTGMLPESVEPTVTPTPPPPTPTPTPTPTPGPADAPTVLTRHPYLGECSPNSVTVAWRTDIASTSTVKYGTTPLLDSQRLDSAMTVQHAVTLDGLEPDTIYYYQVMSNGQPLTSPKAFSTAKPPSQRNFTFAVFGDSGSGSRPQFAIAAAVQAESPDFVLHTGDVLYERAERANLISRGLLEGYEWNTDLTEPELWDPYYFLPYQEIVNNTCVFTATGNHDSGIENTLYLPHNNPLETERFYSFNYGHGHIIAIDSNLAAVGRIGQPKEEQLQWLRADLERANQDLDIGWKIVFLHHGPFSSGQRKPNRPEAAITEIYVPIFEEFGVDAVFAGHDHAYERSCLVFSGTCTAPDEQGILYVVTGGGGHPVLHPDVCQGDCPWSRFRAEVHHFVHVTVEGDTLTGRAIDVDGEVIDTFVVRKGAVAGG